MNVIYICKVSAFQALGKQIDIPEKVATDFFNIPSANIKSSENIGMNICHISDVKTFETIEIQPSRNPRWSTKLNKFLESKGDKLKDGDLLVFEKLGRSFCVRTIPNGDKKYDALIDLFEKDEKHMLLSSCVETQPENIKSTYRPYITAIKSKPFLLLAGISGTGKSRIVRELARSCWSKDSEEYKTQKPSNFEMIQVKPNWHDSTELLGYVSRINGEHFVVGPFLKFMVKAIKNPNIPHFLCLDEMNLAPVEQYFAEYLSVIESRKLSEDGTIVTDPIIDFEPTDAYHSLITQLFGEGQDEERKLYLTKNGGKRLTIPQNLIVVGTVNMDETTFSFSRKVLDRAMTIEMNEVDLRGGLSSHYENIDTQSVDTLIGTAVEGVDVYMDNEAVCNQCLAYLQKVNDQLEGTPYKIAYRTRNEVLLYVINNLPYNIGENGEELEQNTVIARALDEITNMKILSRIEGDESKVSKAFLEELSKTIGDGLSAISSKRYSIKSTIEEGDGEVHIHKSVSLAKLDEMKQKLLASGYTSFWS